MPDFILLDGCVDSAPGQTLRDALTHMAGFVGTIRTDKRAGQVDMEGYGLVRSLVARSLNPRRNQVDYDRLIEHLVIHPYIRRQSPDTRIIVLIPEDLYAGNLNWVHGGSRNFAGRNIVLVSTKRLYPNGRFDPIFFKYIMIHEFGHAFGAATKGRTNTYEELGSHCLNDCVMKQDLGADSGRARFHELHRKNKTFCPQCKNEILRRHRPR